MIVVILMGMILGGASVEQAHFNQCQAIEFKGDACKIERSLCELSPKAESCSAMKGGK